MRFEDVLDNNGRPSVAMLNRVRKAVAEKAFWQVNRFVENKGIDNPDDELLVRDLLKHVGKLKDIYIDPKTMDQETANYIFDLTAAIHRTMLVVLAKHMEHSELPEVPDEIGGMTNDEAKQLTAMFAVIAGE